MSHLFLVLSPPPHSHFFMQLFAILSQKSVSVSQVLYADRQVNVVQTICGSIFADFFVHA